MKKAAFNLAVTIGLILFAATVGLWLLSYRYSLTVERNDVDYGLESPHWDQRTLAVQRGGIVYESRFGAWRVYTTDPLVGVGWHVQIDPAKPYPRFDPFRVYHEHLNRISGFRGLGFTAKRQLDLAYGHLFARKTMLIVPLPFVTFVFGLLPGLSFICAMRHRLDLRRARIGLCRKCGYDLRASPDRCPECGTVAS